MFRFRKLLFSVCILSCGFSIVAQKITLEDIWTKYAYLPNWVEGFNVLKNGSNYALVEENNGATVLSLYDLKSGKKVKDLVNGNDVKFGNRSVSLKNYHFGPGEDKLLLQENSERIYRHSQKADHYIFDINSKKTISLSDKGKQMFPKFSPDGNKVAFVRDNNLYIKNIQDEKEQIVSSDGEANKIKNGWGVWVFGEEFSKPVYFDGRAVGETM